MTLINAGSNGEEVDDGYEYEGDEAYEAELIRNSYSQGYMSGYSDGWEANDDRHLYGHDEHENN